MFRVGAGNAICQLSTVCGSQGHKQSAVVARQTVAVVGMGRDSHMCHHRSVTNHLLGPGHCQHEPGVQNPKMIRAKIPIKARHAHTNYEACWLLE